MHSTEDGFSMLTFIENLKNIDPFFEEINILIKQNHLIQDLEGFVLDESNSKILRLVQSLRLCILYPHKKRGFLSSYDLLTSFGFFNEAKDFLQLALSRDPHCDLYLKRLIILNIQERAYEEAISNYFTYFPYIKNDINFHNRFDSFLSNIYVNNKQETTVYSNFSMSNLYDAIKQLNREKAIEATWKIYNSGLISKSFFSIASNPLLGERGSAERVIAFRRLSYKFYPDDYEFLYNEVTALLISNREKAASNLIISKIKEVLFSCTPIYLKKKIYSLYLKLLPLSGQSITDPVLSLDQSKELNVQDLAYFDYIHCISALKRQYKDYSLLKNKFDAFYSDKKLAYTIWDVIDKSITLSNNTVKIKRGVCISGQLRGFSDIKESFKTNFNHETIYSFSVWKNEIISPSRPSALQRILPQRAIKLLPTHIQNIPEFEAEMPLTFKKIMQPKKIPISDSHFTIFDKKIVDIVEEKSFEDDLISESDKYFIRGKLNQAKMFALISRSIQPCLENTEIVYRLRPDFIFRHDNLEFYENICIKNKDIIYVNGFVYTGIGDQFAFGSNVAMMGYASLFDISRQFKRLSYSIDFDKSTQDFAAEDLLAWHLSLMGLRVKKIPLDYNNLYNPAVNQDFTEILSTMQEDVGHKPEFNSFISYFSEKKTTNI